MLSPLPLVPTLAKPPPPLPPSSATFVKARDVFNSHGMEASVGSYAFGFSWGAWAALLIATTLFCVGVRGRAGSSRDYKRRSGGGSTRRRTSTRSHEMGNRRVKDEYS